MEQTGASACDSRYGAGLGVVDPLIDYVHKLHIVSQKNFSDHEIIEWAKDQKLDSFFDETSSDLQYRFNAMMVEPILDGNSGCIPTNLCCPEIFAHDADLAMQYDWKNGKQLLVRKDGNISAQIPAWFSFSRWNQSSWPLFSPEGTWLVGVANGSTHVMRTSVYVIKCGRAFQHNNLEISASGLNFDWAPSQINYAFIDEERMVMSISNKLYMGRLEDIAEHGNSALKEIYERTGGKYYTSPLFLRVIYPLSDSVIACIGPSLKNIEVIKHNKDSWNCGATLPIQDVSIGYINVNRVRGLALVTINNIQKSVWLYQLIGCNPGEKSKIDIEHLENNTCRFSPSGEFLACCTQYLRQNIKIFNCTDVALPVCIATIQIPEPTFRDPSIEWTMQGLILRDGWGKQHNIEFNRAAPLVQRYAAYRKKQKAAQKQKESNNNNA